LVIRPEFVQTLHGPGFQFLKFLTSDVLMLVKKQMRILTIKICRMRIEAVILSVSTSGTGLGQLK